MHYSRDRIAEELRLAECNGQDIPEPGGDIVAAPLGFSERKGFDQARAAIQEEAGGDNYQGAEYE